MQGTETELFPKNTWSAKLKRTATGILPVDKNRKGECRHCGACCKLPNHCPFLGADEHGLCTCKIYWFRPLNCRKYPRTKSELITTDTCGYDFDEDEINN